MSNIQSLEALYMSGVREEGWEKIQKKRQYAKLQFALVALNGIFCLINAWYLIHNPWWLTLVAENVGLLATIYHWRCATKAFAAISVLIKEMAEAEACRQRLKIMQGKGVKF